RFFLVKGNNFVSAFIKLPVGVIEGGKIKDKNNFKIALSKLHSQITLKLKKKIYIILSVPDINVYAQVFNLPMMAVDSLNNAAKLNLQMISPTDFSGVYADWQKIGEVENDGGQFEILSAFIQRQIVDEFIDCLKEANFVISAIEFPSLAVSRLISGFSVSVSNVDFLLRLNAGGLSFSLIKKNNLYFNHFVPWPISEERQISINVLKDLIVRETQKVLNFSSKHWPGTVFNNILLIAPALEDKISQIISENFSLSVQKLILPSKLTSVDGQWSIINDKLPSLTSDWFGVLGSAVRGLIPRSEDIIISLADTGTEEEFRQHRIVNFIKIWRNIILTSLVFILIAFIAIDAFFIKTVNSLNNQFANFINQPQQKAFGSFEKEVKNFNDKVKLALQAKNQVSDFTPFFEKIKNLTGKEIIIDRIFIQSSELPILFNARAINEKAIIDFKTAMGNDSEFKEINLPLSGITQSSDGLFKFSITFKYK
ncbi:MAG: hypothetical protein AAB696_01310, partial [Patescibacteria group bacterium]